MKRIAFTLFAVLAVAGAALAQDVVRLRSGVEVKGKVTALTSKNVAVLEAGNKTTPLKAEDVASVTLGDPPPSLAKAEQAVGEGRWEKAINLYPAALEEITKEKKREYHKQYVLWSWAVALDAKGNTQEALDMLKRLRTECADCFLRAESWRKSREMAKAKSDDLLVQVLTEMKSEPEPVGAEAEIEIAKLKYNKGDYEQAAALFARQNSKEAMLWNLRCVRQLKKQADLESLCTKILGDRTNNPPALLQAAGSSMASIQLGKAGGDKAKVKEVLMIALQAIAMGPPSGRDEGEDYALALITGAKCYATLAKDLEKPEAKEEYRQRAIGYLREVKGAYSRTAWADQAQKELIAIGEEKPKEGSK